jgi:tetratricopeptide (TPR) repeat protein
MLAQARQMLGVDPARAAVLARQLLKRTPDAAEPHFILGAALRRSGDLHAALAVIAPLAEAQPGAWGLQYEHGVTLAALGQCDAALAALMRATQANPHSSLAWHALGDQLFLLGQPVAAADAQGRPVPGSAGDPALAAAAAALFDGRDGAAADGLRTRFGIDLNDVASLRLLADVGMRLGRHENVAHLLAAAIQLAPEYLPARFHQAIMLYRLERPHAAIAEIEPVLAARPGVATLWALRAAIHMQLGHEGQAVQDFGAALARDRDDARIWHGYGHALRAVGRQAEAVEAYRQAIALAPAFGEAYWSLANLKTWRFEAGDVDRMAALLASGGPAPEDRCYLHFAIGKAKEDEARFAESFEHYQSGNAARRAMLPYDAAGHADFVRRTIATFSPRFFAERSGVGAEAADPIFVLGMPRSGSTLIEQILASHSAVEGASELPDITAIARRLSTLAAAETGRGDTYPGSLADMPRAGFAELGAVYLERTRVRRSAGRPFFVDKFPGNFMHVGLIHLMLPKARIVDVRRNPLACCVSLFKQCFAQGQAYSHDLADLGDYFAQYETLMAHFATVLPGRVLRVSYEAIVEDPEHQMRRLLDYCGLDFEADCLRFFATDRAIRTPSSEQVRRPIFRDGLDQWRNFQPWLKPLVDALGPLADEASDTS